MADLVLVTLIYNRKRYLMDALQSALNQTLDKSKWIHVLVDNGSTDGAEKIAEGFYNAHKDSNIKLIHLEKNLGIQGGHNYVLNNFIPQHCPEAKIFSLLESDDMLPTNSLEEVYKTFVEHPEIGETYSDFSSMDANGRIIYPVYPGKALFVDDQFTPEGQKKLRQMFNHNPVGHQRSYSISALRDIGGFDPQYEYANDVEVAFRMVEKYPIVKIHKVLYTWRDHHDSATGYNTAKQRQQALHIIDIYMKKWKEQGLI